MLRIISVLSLIGVSALPVLANDGIPVGGVPEGVLIYDSVPTAPSQPVVLPSVGPVTSAPATTFVLTPASTAQQIQSLASTRSSTAQPVVTGTVFDPVSVIPQIDLAPGETVVRAIAVTPSIIQIPNPQPVYTSRYEPSPAARVLPPPKRDPVTGRLRDTPGWTGRREAPASIGCFPAGACAVLNAR